MGEDRLTYYWSFPLVEDPERLLRNLSHTIDHTDRILIPPTGYSPSPGEGGEKIYVHFHFQNVNSGWEQFCMHAVDAPSRRRGPCQSYPRV